MNRERLGSRLGFILLSAGCAIGCGNVWKFPWLTGQNGGGGFVLIYVLCLLFLGLPVMTMEFSVGRAAQASPVHMYKKLQKPGQKWGSLGYLALLGNVALMAFYTVVAGWMIYYFCMFVTGKQDTLSFVSMITNPTVNVVFLAVTVVIGFAILSFNLQGGLERVTKYMMCALFVLMLVLAGRSVTLPGAAEGLSFYLLPDLSKITGSTVVAAMNQAFFTLSLGIGSMAIFGSYLDKDRSLMGESVNVIILDSLVAITAGLIIFPACFTYVRQHGRRPFLGQCVLPLHGLRCTLHRSGSVREHPRLCPRAHRLGSSQGLCDLRYRYLPAGSDHRSGLQRVRFPALCRGQRMAGLLGFHRQHQSVASGFSGLCPVLLQ